MSNGGSIKVVKTAAGDHVVSITRTDEVALTVYASDLTTPITMPSTVTATTTYYVLGDNNYTVSVKVNGAEVSQTPNGTARTVQIEGGRQLVFSPEVQNTQVAGVPGAWTAYTPTLAGTGWDVGNGTCVGYFAKNGTRVDFKILLTFGSSTAAGSASATFTLPKTAATATSGSPLVATLFDTSATARYAAHARLSSTTVVTVSSVGTAGLLGLTDTTTPFTWATGDTVALGGSFEAAS